MTYIKCLKCGTENPPNSNNCKMCGANLESNKESVIPDSRIVYVIADTLDDAVLAEGESFEDYCVRIDETAPYGRDPKGVAHLFPVENKNMFAYREGMEYRCDWGGFRKSGLGWKLNPTFFLALVLILPTMLAYPIVYLIFTGSINIFLRSLLDSTILWSPYLLIVVLLTELFKYGSLKLEKLLKPYGEEHESVKLLFKDELEFLKFSKKFFNSVFSYKWMYLGVIGFIFFMGYAVIGLFDMELFRKNILAPIPEWTRFLVIPGNLAQGLIVFTIFSFIGAIFYGLFRIGNLGSDRSKLSISKFGEMILSINHMVAESQIKKTKLSDAETKLDISGRTFYEFQRGNRKIGEFLFNIAAFLIFISVLLGVLIWVAQMFNLIPEAQKANLKLFTLATAIFGIFSISIFIFPQLKIHRFLKKYKYYLIDTFSSLCSRLEYLYFEGIIHPSMLTKIDSEWKTRQDILEDINLIKEFIEEIKAYGTWSYDFPEILKLLVVAGSTIIPLILTFVKF